MGLDSTEASGSAGVVVGCGTSPEATRAGNPSVANTIADAPPGSPVGKPEDEAPSSCPVPACLAAPCWVAPPEGTCDSADPASRVVVGGVRAAAKVCSKSPTSVDRADRRDSVVLGLIAVAARRGIMLLTARLLPGWT